MRLLLVRHGLSSFNKELRIQGRSDLSILSEEGVSQAISTGKRLNEVSINHAYSSPLQRAKETTKNILKQQNKEITPIFTNELLEVDLGHWSGLTQEEVESKYPKEYKTWKQEPKSLIMTREGGSSYNPIKELIKQSDYFLKNLIERHSTEVEPTILIVGHNAILRCVILRLLRNPPLGFRRLQLDNASISIINLNSTKENSHEIQIECLNSTTHLTPIIPKKKRSSRLLLVRHGETDWNLEGRFQGQIDIPLNETGKKQARAASEFLKDVPIQKAFSSSMSRPKETGEIILKNHPGIKMELQEDLIEIGHGEWEGKLDSEINEHWPTLLASWKSSPETIRMPQGESIQDVSSRALNCWRKIIKSLKPDETALVVAHDAVNKTILCNLLGLTPADIWMVKQGNGGISIVDITEDPNQPNIISCLNITSHLGGVFDDTASGAL